MKPDVFEGYVLAGGKSSRMGLDKAFLKIGGETFCERAAESLNRICAKPAKVILNRNQTGFTERISAKIPCIFDVFENHGAPGGIYTALKDSGARWTFVLACDMPLVTAETLKNLANFAFHSEGETAAIVPREQDGKIQPLCAVYRRDLCLSPLENLLQSQNSFSVRDFLAAISARFIEADFISGGNDFFNVNTPLDFEKLPQKLS